MHIVSHSSNMPTTWTSGAHANTAIHMPMHQASMTPPRHANKRQVETQDRQYVVCIYETSQKCNPDNLSTFWP